MVTDSSSRIDKHREFVLRAEDSELSSIPSTSRVLTHHLNENLRL